MHRLSVIALIAVVGAFLAVGCASEPKSGGKKVGEWIKMLSNGDWAARSGASDVLARLGPPVLPYLKDALGSKDPAVRKGVVEVLGRMGSDAREVAPQLLNVIPRENVATIRAEILKALVAIDPEAPGVPEEITKRLRDVDPEVQDSARQALERLNQKKAPIQPVAPAAPEKKFGDEGMTFELRQAVAKEIVRTHPGTDFILVAEVARADKRAAVVWPGIKDGVLHRDDVVAYVFGRGEGNAWVKATGPVTLSDAGAGSSRLAEALGGADGQHVIRPCGIRRDELAEHLIRNATALKNALAGRKLPEATAAYEELLKAFSFPLAAFSATVPELLIQGVFDTPLQLKSLQAADTATITLSVDKKPQNAQISIRPCGGEWVVTEIVRL